MGTVVKLAQRSTKLPQASADAIQADTVHMRPRVTRDHIAVAASSCEIFSRSIVALRENIETLDIIIGKIDDPETRETFRHQMRSIEAALSLGSVGLSSIRRRMEAALCCERPAIDHAIEN